VLERKPYHNLGKALFGSPFPESGNQSPSPSAVLQVGVAESLQQVLLFIMDENWRTQTDEKRRPDGEEKRVDEQRECNEQWHFTQGLRVPYVLVYSPNIFVLFEGRMVSWPASLIPFIKIAEDGTAMANATILPTSGSG